MKKLDSRQLIAHDFQANIRINDWINRIEGLRWLSDLRTLSHQFKSVPCPLHKDLLPEPEMVDLEIKHKDITRLDQASKFTHGWYVRVKSHGQSYNKYFSDKLNDGRKGSLEAAIAWRDQIRSKLGKPASDKTIVTLSRPESRTGVVGVNLNKKRASYMVTWVTTDGKQGKTSVSITKHGLATALERAIQIRKKKEAERLMPTDTTL